jgi:hypothetical protein
MGLIFCEKCGALLRGKKCPCETGESLNKLMKNNKIINKSSRSLENNQSSCCEFLDIVFDLTYLKEKIFELDPLKLGFNPKEKAKYTCLQFNERNRISTYCSSKNEIELGMKLYKLDKINLKRKELLHEFIHACGLSHNQRSRHMGYYSNIFQDTFTDNVLKLVGWDVPTEDDYNEYREKVKEYYQGKKDDYIEDAKYKLSCPNCEFEAYRKTYSKVVRKSQDVICPKCNHVGLEVEIL